MNYEEWLMHFNENHDPKNGQFTSSNNAKAIVKSAKKAIKKGVYKDFLTGVPKKARKHVKDIKKRVNDSELNRLIEKSRESFDEFRTAKMNYRLGKSTEKKMNAKYDEYQANMDARIKRSNYISKQICETVGIEDAEFERKLSLMIR